MSIADTLKRMFGVGETTTFSARRKAEPKDGEPHAGILVTVGAVTLLIDAGDFSRALGPGGERVKALVVEPEAPAPKRAI